MRLARSISSPARLAQALALLLAAAAIALAGSAASAEAASGKASLSGQGKSRKHVRSHKRHRAARRHKAAKRRRSRRQRRAKRARRIRRLSRSSDSRIGVRQSRAVAGSADGANPDAPLIDAGFEQGLLNWNIAGVGEVVPSVVSGNARSGSNAGRVVLAGTQNRSELGLGGDGTREPSDVEFREGDEYWFGFSFNIQRMVYGGPGAHNLIMQFHQQGEGSPNFGLQLWDYEGDDGQYAGNSRGLWSHSEAMGGDRFLSPVSERAWHDIAIHFRASNHGQGFYELYLDGRLIDARAGISMIRPGFDSAYIKTGLYRNGETAPGTSELLLDDGRLGLTAASVQP